MSSHASISQTKARSPPPPRSPTRPQPNLQAKPSNPSRPPTGQAQHPSSSHSVHSSSSTSQRAQLVLNAHPSTFIGSDGTRLEGDITLSAGCVVHPRACIVTAPGAKVVFGENCVIEENTVLRFPGSGVARVGANNVFMVGCRVDFVAGDAVGDWNTFAPRSTCLGVRVGDACTIGAGTVLGPHHVFFSQETGKDAEGDVFMDSPRSPTSRGPTPVLPDKSVVYGAESAVRTWDGSGEAQERGVRVSSTEYLREVLPKFNRAVKTGPSSAEGAPRPPQTPQQQQRE